ncbi:small-conductance mechanosensitive channel [Elusimicrobium posterum]|uniref:mechanosensitive ion channel family protein n=1 Tax=Elusimicrobium posterum TaxID=3116653 RepID=UPI003C74F1B9
MKRHLLAVLFVFIFALAAFAQEANPEVPHAKVAPFGKELFQVYGGLGAADAPTRAKIIEGNMQDLAKDVLFSPQEMTVERGDNSDNIVYRGKVIAGVTDQQAEAEGKTRMQTAEIFMDIILQAVKEEHSVYYETNRTKKYILGAIVIFAAAFFFWLISRFNRVVKNYIHNFEPGRNSLIYKIVDVNAQKRPLLVFFAFLKYILYTVVFFLAVLFILELFPQTRHFALAAIESITIPLRKALWAFYHYIPNLINIIVIVVVFTVVLKLLHSVAKKTSEGKVDIMGFHPEWAIPTYHIIRVIVIVFAFVLIFPYLPGAESPAFKGVSVFIGVLLSLGSTSLISNVMSGMVITYMRPFKEGDYVKMGDVTGEVIEKNTLVTRMRTFKNEIITIPNSKIMSSDTINYTNSAKNYGLIMHVNVTIGYDEDWRKVHKLLIEAAGKTIDTLQSPAPFVLQTELENFAVRYELNVYTSMPEKLPKLYSELYSNVQDVFNREDIEIMTPSVNVIRGLK